MFPFKTVQPDILTHDGDVVGGLACIHTPGHTPGTTITWTGMVVPILRRHDGLPEREDKGPSARFNPDMKETNDLSERERNWILRYS
jgi:hypothetical protein